MKSLTHSNNIHPHHHLLVKNKPRINLYYNTNIFIKSLSNDTTNNNPNIYKPSQNKLQIWTNVDEYFTSHLLQNQHNQQHLQTALTNTLKTSDEHNLPQINVSPQQGAFLNLLSKVHGSRSILELGTLAGYSTLWFIDSVESNGGGQVISLEIDPKHAELARTNVKQLLTPNTQTEIRVGPALQSLAELYQQGKRFDFTFIDADKKNNVEYVKWAIKLSTSTKNTTEQRHKRSIIVIDNVVRNGGVLDGTSMDESVMGSRAVVEYLSSKQLQQELILGSCAMQTVGVKGWDGFIIVYI
jgi:predicted O-methyltransferase YrrM